MRAPSQRVSATAKVTSKGQITIPRAVRRALGLKTGSQVQFDVDEHGHALMSPRSGEVAALFALVPRQPRRKKMSLDDMERAIRAGAVRDCL